MVQGACQSLVMPSPAAAPATLVAPVWHLRALVVLMLSVAVTGSVLAAAAMAPTTATDGVAGGYVPLVVANLGLAAYVCRLGLGHSIFKQLFVRGSYDMRRVALDVLVAAGLALLLITAENGFQSWSGFAESSARAALIPHRRWEQGVWLLVAAVVGFSEELVYRGYLQRQLTALSGRLAIGVAAQALLFGIAHGAQGPWAVGRFAVYAVVLGAVAAARRSLVPCVLCHVALDCLAGLTG